MRYSTKSVAEINTNRYGLTFLATNSNVKNSLCSNWRDWDQDSPKIECNDQPVNAYIVYVI